MPEEEDFDEEEDYSMCEICGQMTCTDGDHFCPSCQDDWDDES